MSDLLIVTGPPGSGKSTVALLLAERFEPCVLVHGDVFFGFVVRGYIDPWLPGSHEQNVVVTEAAATATGRFPKGGYTTIFDGMVGPWFLETFLEHAQLDSVQYAVLMPSLETCTARVMGRNGHGFRDEPATRRMYAAFADAEIAPRHLLRSDADDPASVALELFQRYESGSLIYPAHAGPT
jgi:AAA domain-containing protein